MMKIGCFRFNWFWNCCCWKMFSVILFVIISLRLVLFMIRNNWFWLMKRLIILKILLVRLILFCWLMFKKFVWNLSNRVICGYGVKRERNNVKFNWLSLRFFILVMVLRFWLVKIICKMIDWVLNLLIKMIFGFMLRIFWVFMLFYVIWCLVMK